MAPNAGLGLLLAVMSIVGPTRADESTLYFARIARPQCQERLGIYAMPAEGGRALRAVPRATALDALVCSADGRRLYWAFRGEGIIVTGDGAAQQSHWLAGNHHARCLALDDKAGRLYYADSVAGDVIKSCDLRGKDVQVLVSGVRRPWAVAVDPKLGLLYWAQSRSQGSLDDEGVWSVTLTEGKLTDTSARKHVVKTTLADGAIRLAVDVERSRIFWTTIMFQQQPLLVMTAAFDGSDPTVVVEVAPYTYVDGLAVDPRSGKVFWSERPTDGGYARIRSALVNDATSVKTVWEFKDDDYPTAIAIGPPLTP